MAIWPKTPPGPNDDARYLQLRLLRGRTLRKEGYISLTARYKVHRSMLRLYNQNLDPYFFQLEAKSMQIIHTALKEEGVFRHYFSFYNWDRESSSDSESSDNSKDLDDSEDSDPLITV